MADLTPEERALIDAALAQGKVTQVAPGTTGYPPLVWCPHRNVLIYDNPADAQRRQALENPEVRERRAKLREMAETDEIPDGRGRLAVLYLDGEKRFQKETLATSAGERIVFRK